MMGNVPNQPKTKSRNVRVDDELWHEAKSIATAGGTNLSEVIRSFLQSYVERHRASKVPREISPELRKILDQYGIDESSVADGYTDVNYSHMWRSKMAWPAGGTYEAMTPQGPDDEMVARRVTLRAELTLVGIDRSVLERVDQFEILPTSSSDNPDLYRVTLVDRGQWEFFDK